MKKLVFDFLERGEENAFSSDYLKNVLGFTSTRSLQKQIERERSQGYVILSSTTGGYYRAADATEIRKFIQTLERRGEKTLSAIVGAKRALEEMGGQCS